MNKNYFSALILLVAVGFIVSNAKYRKINLVFYSIISSCIYLHHASSNAVIKPLFYPESRYFSINFIIFQSVL